MSRLRFHVLRSEFSPSMGLRQATLTREPVRASKRHEALSDALGDTLDHMERSGEWIVWNDLRPHDCQPFVCDRTEDHVYLLAYQDGSSVTTLRLAPA